MESKLTALVIMGFLAVAGLSVDSVCGSPVEMGVKNVTTDANVSVNITTQPSGNKIDLVLKVEAVYHKGKVKKFMSFLRNGPSSLDSNGTPPQTEDISKSLAELVPQLPKYTEWFHRIPPPSLPFPILTAADTTCRKKNDFLWLSTGNGNTSDFLVPPKREELYTGLVAQCDPNNYPILVEQRPSKFWYLNSCSSEKSLDNNSSGDVNVPDPVTFLYTIYLGVGTPKSTMTISPLANLANVSSFLQNFPFDLMEIKTVILRVDLYNDREKGQIKEVMERNKFVVQEKELLSTSGDSDCFIVFVYLNEPVPMDWPSVICCAILVILPMVILFVIKYVIEKYNKSKESADKASTESEH